LSIVSGKQLQGAVVTTRTRIDAVDNFERPCVNANQEEGEEDELRCGDHVDESILRKLGMEQNASFYNSVSQISIEHSIDKSFSMKKMQSAAREKF
jgi:hypothetical protein